METVFRNSLKGLTKKEKTKAYWDRNNKLDIELKQRRDDETGTLTVIEDLNHTLSELGQRGWSYRTLNRLAGQQIAMKARSKGDRRRLDLLDHIKTPGGVYGHTVEGMKLKQATLNQMEADAEADEANERAAYTHGFKETLNNYKMEIGQLLKEKAAETDPNKIQEIEKKIQNTLVNAGTEGVGGQLQIYKNRLTGGIESLTQGKNRIVGWNDVVHPDSVDKRTVRDRVVGVMADPATDASLKSRENRIATEFDGENITPNPELLKLFKRINDSFVAPLSTSLWTNELNYQKAIIKNNLLPFNMYTDWMAKSRGLGKERPIPRNILERLAKADRDLKSAFVQHFDTYSTSLEQRPEEENPRYGFGEWIEPEKDFFVGSPEYREKVRKITNDLDVDLKKLTAPEVPKITEERAHEKNIKNVMPARKEGPEDFMSLQRMIYDDDDGVAQRHYSVFDTYERLKKAVFGAYLLEVGYKDGSREVTFKKADGTKETLTVDQLKDIGNIHTFSTDIDNWLSEAIAGTDDPKVKLKQIQAIWDWGIYLIKREKIKNISLDNSLSNEQREKEIKAYRESKLPFPKEITSFIGAKKILEEETKKQENSNKSANQVNKKPDKPKSVQVKKRTTSKNNNIPTTEAGKKALREQVEWEKKNIIDPIKNTWNRLFGD